MEYVQHSITISEFIGTLRQNLLVLFGRYEHYLKGGTPESLLDTE